MKYNKIKVAVPKSSTQGVYAITNDIEMFFGIVSYEYSDGQIEILPIFKDENEIKTRRRNFTVNKLYFNKVYLKDINKEIINLSLVKKQLILTLNKNKF